jgi:hypothetical protein
MFQVLNLIEICPVRAELFYADERTDVTILIVVFCNFANAPNNEWLTKASCLQLWNQQHTNDSDSSEAWKKVWGKVWL